MIPQYSNLTPPIPFGGRFAMLSPSLPSFPVEPLTDIRGSLTEGNGERAFNAMKDEAKSWIRRLFESKIPADEGPYQPSAISAWVQSLLAVLYSTESRRAARNRSSGTDRVPGYLLSSRANEL